MRITVYTKPMCIPCRATLRALDMAGVRYVERDIASDSTAEEVVRALGYATAPVVTVHLPDGVDHWSGYKPDQLAALAYLATDVAPPRSGPHRRGAGTIS